MLAFLLYVGVLIFIELMYVYLGFYAYRHGEIDAGRNNFAFALVFGIAFVFALVFSPFSPILPYPFDMVTVFFFLAFFFIFYIFMVREEHNPQKREMYEFGIGKLSLKYDIYRKLSHFVVAGIFLIYFYFGPIFIEFFNTWMKLTPTFWNVSEFSSPTSTYGQYVTVFFVGISFIGLNLTDFVRILRPEAYPLKAVNKILREREKGTMLGPQVAFSIGCFSVVLMIGPYFPRIACAAMGISSFGDAAANIIGRRFGKHKMRGPKTWEGLIGGAAVSFIVSFFFLIYEENLLTTNLVTPLIVALSGTVTFCIVDYFTPVVSDNLLNAFLTGSIMVITGLFIAG